MRRKRERNPRFIGRQWCIQVEDGNGDAWLTNFPDCPTGVITTSHGDMTPEIGRDILRVLRETAEWWEQHLAEKPTTSGDVVQFKPKNR